MFKKAMLIAISLVSCNHVFADMESLENMQAVAKQFLTSNITAAPDEKISVEVNPIDVQLPKCSQALNAALPANTIPEQATSVDISCNDNPSWHMMIPVTIKVFTNVVVAKHLIPANEPITADDVGMEQYDKNQLYSGYFKSVAEVVGSNAAHLLASGSVLTPKSIQQPVIIHRNQKINVTVKKQSIVLNMQGIAKSDGPLKGLIQVYNPSSKRTIDAVVTGPNEAEISL